MSVALGYIVVRCEALEDSVRFYRTLGLELVRERHGGGPEHYSARIGELVLELYPARTERTAGVRLGLIVDDLAGVVARLIEGGAEVSQRGGEWVVVDPDGHVVALSPSG